MLVVRNLPANVGDTGDLGLILRLGRSPRGGNGNHCMASHSRTLAWKLPWTEEPGRLQSMGSRRVGHNESDLAAAAATYL